MKNELFDSFNGYYPYLMCFDRECDWREEQDYKIALHFSWNCHSVIALVAVPGVQYFGGHNPSLIGSMLPASLNGTLASMYNTGIVYVFSDFEKIFIFIMGLVAFLAVLTYFTEKKEISGPYLYLIFMGLAAVTALMLSDDIFNMDIFNMYVFFEITALTQVGIIIATNTDDNYEIALKYLIIGSIGGPMLLLGIGFILGTIGSLNITDIAYVINHNLVDPLSPGLVIGFVLILFGWFYVSGLPPFHTIKSAVYSKARPNGAAILQGFSVMCMLAFGIALIRIFHHMPYFNQLLVLFAIIAMVLSVSMAAMQWDFRRMIAFWQLESLVSSHWVWVLEPNCHLQRLSSKLLMKYSFPLCSS